MKILTTVLIFLKYFNTFSCQLWYCHSNSPISIKRLPSEGIYWMPVPAFIAIIMYPCCLLRFFVHMHMYLVSDIFHISLP